MNKNIHQPYTKFKGWLRENGLTYADIALDLGLSESTISLKVNGQSDFFLCEIKRIQEKYHIGSDIFFTDFVA